MALPHLTGLFGDQSALQGNGANPMLPSLAQDGESRRTHRWAERAQLSAESAMSEADIILSADLTLPLETVNALNSVTSVQRNRRVRWQLSSGNKGDCKGLFARVPCGSPKQ